MPVTSPTLLTPFLTGPAEEGGSPSELWTPANVNEVGNEIYELIKPLTYQDQALGYPILRLTDGLGLMWDDINKIIRDKFEPNGTLRPGYADVMDLARCPELWLPWLAQFAGVEAPANHAELDRELIIEASGMRRGTVAAIKAYVQLFLTGEKHVSLYERAEGSAWRITVVTLESETPSPSQIATLLAGDSVVPAGIVVKYKNVKGWVYEGIAKSGKTYKQLKEEFANYERLSLNQP